ncbi:MAG: heterodisulfide reductase-related iron-sulfur binding cluster [Planctomycetaceae bacterium]|nr:heterodisulfide reductase-related iron-sulfur binding cluster [bacterium]MDC0273120.1 heterodisulfide reductase-related iron-sulfur binding cluster [Planctomycetaceae bacterium]MDG2387818.1 heterodisulfide reductase-related iron-sulfur binding cluster [Planctomycetaceae bacterium]
MNNLSPTTPDSPQNPTGDHALSIVGGKIDYTKFLDCVHCGLCTSACPTYLETGDENDSPRGRIYLMRAVVDERIELTDTVQRHLDLCLDCRSCETACPSGVQYGRLIEPFRVDTHKRDQAAGKKTGGWFQSIFLHGLFPYPDKLKWALAPARIMQRLKLDRVIDAIGLPKLLPTKLRRLYQQLPKLQRRGKKFPHVLPAKGEKRARVGLFTGCVAEAMFSQTNRATARVLQENGCDVVIPNTQGCCGAIHYHSGAEQPALEFARQNAEAFLSEDLDAVIINVAGCGAMLKDYHHLAEEIEGTDEATAAKLSQFTAKVKDISEFLMELGPREPKGKIPLNAVYHDACHLCHAQQIRSQPRELLSMIPGLTLTPLAESEICCGAAGSYNLTEPEMADRLGQRKVKNILKGEPEAVITGNAGCSLQIQAVLRNKGEPLPVYHPVDLLDCSYRCVPLEDYN